jgi:hypothetical protein
MSNLSRRHFLTAGALATATAMPGLSAGAPAAPVTRPPRDVGRKFRADGTVMPFGGNTFIGHVEQQGAGYESFDGLLDIYREAPGHAFAAKIAWTPPSSYHVTVFGGLNDEDKGTQRWPRDVPPAVPVSAVTAMWLRRLQERPRLAEPRFEFAFGATRIMTEGAPHVPLQPANDRTARRLAALRDTLAEFTGIRDQNHATYQYHLTFGYIHRMLSDQEALALKMATDGWIRQLAARIGTIAIPAVQFCSLADMYAFRVLHAL